MSVFIKSLIAILFVTIFGSCNPTTRAYKGIEKYSPITDIDSLRLSKRSLTTWPLGRDSTKIGVTIVLSDSSVFYKAKFDSLKKIVPEKIKEIYLKYKDTCVSTPYAYEEGYNLGYDVGFYDGKKNCQPSTLRVDTFFRTPKQVVIQLATLETSLRDEKNQNIKLTTERELYKKQAKNRLYLLILIFAIIILIIGIKIYKMLNGGAVMRIFKNR